MAIKGETLTITLTAWDTANNEPKTGDAANISAYVSKDGAAEAAASNSVSELDATNCPGEYTLDLTASEMNADFVLVTGTSSTADVVVYPVKVITEKGRIDAAIGSRSTLAQSDILSDGTPFAGGNVDVQLSTLEDNIRGADDDDLKVLSDQVDGLNDPTAADIADEVRRQPFAVSGDGMQVLEDGAEVTKDIDITLSGEYTGSEDISGADITWAILPFDIDDWSRDLDTIISEQALVTYTTGGGGVSVTDGAAGEFEVYLKAADTAALDIGRYWALGRITQTDGTQLGGPAEKLIFVAHS